MAEQHPDDTLLLLENVVRELRELGKESDLDVVADPDVVARALTLAEELRIAVVSQDAEQVAWCYSALSHYVGDSLPWTHDFLVSWNRFEKHMRRCGIA